MFIFLILKEVQMHRGSFALDTLCPYLAFMVFYYLLYYGKSYSATALLRIAGFISSVKSFKYSSNILARYTLSVIRHNNMDVIPLIIGIITISK